MPLFTRSDGEPIAGLSPLRRIMPHLMRTRNGSCVYYRQQLELSKTLPFLEDWNRAQSDRLTVFELILAACGRVLHVRPGLNRFVAGGRIYQRRGVQVSFAVKKRLTADAPTEMVKLELHAGEAVRDTTQRMRAAIRECRAGTGRALDVELRLVTALPSALLTGTVELVRRLDAWNLLPQSLERGDPLFASMVLANLGGLGLEQAFHHLYEYGTASMFGAVGAIRKAARFEATGQLSAHDVIDVCWTFDERINDGFYCAAALELLRQLVEDPAPFVQGASEPELADAGALDSAAQ